MTSIVLMMGTVIINRREAHAGKMNRYGCDLFRDAIGMPARCESMHLVQASSPLLPTADSHRASYLIH